MPLLAASQLPLVSIVIINWNYARYLGTTIESVLNQDYANFECIIVDNGSTDDSRSVIKAIVAKDSRFREIFYSENLGQLGAFFSVFDALNGNFVVVLDADDILSENFLSTHVQVHLALDKPVAFTSSQTLEIDNQGLALTGKYAFGTPLPWASPSLLDGSQAPRLATISDQTFNQLTTHVARLPFMMAGWFWAPGSSNMYRRSVLRVIHQERTPKTYLRAADAYISPFCHALGGSALIDVPLSQYRIHDVNYFTLHENLGGMRNGRAEFSARNINFAEETVEFMFAQASRFHALLGSERYWAVLEQMSRSIASTRSYKLPMFWNIVAKHITSLRKAFTDDELIGELALRLRPQALAQLLLPQENSKTSALFAARLLWRALKVTLFRRQKRRVRLGYGIDWQSVPPQGYKWNPRNFGPIAVLSTSPSIIKTGLAFEEWLGIAGAYGRMFGDTPAGFLVYPTWSIEEPKRISSIAQSMREHQKRYPSHRIVFMGNTQRESDLLAAQGIPSVFLNKNFSVSDQIFRPLENVTPEYDAIYNARFVPEKRYELSKDIHRFAYIGYLDGSEEEQQDQMVLLEEMQRTRPHHLLLNPAVDGRPIRLSQAETNARLNLARVGLCLSEVEGSNYASMEYMLAGLPVVSTTSLGGRDVYFDPEFCIVCEPDPDAVAKAVDALKNQNIPREYIRNRTIEKLQPARRRFLELVNEMRQALDHAPVPIPDSWPHHYKSGMVTWDTFDNHLRRLGRDSMPHRTDAEFVISRDVISPGDQAIQLTPEEMAPIVRSIQSIPSCKLLVFGCGNDSPFWEKVNANGKTVFLEDDPAWIEQVGPQLNYSRIVPVNYGTCVAEWPELLTRGEELRLDLPTEILDQKWDVIIVDGPAGYRPDLPGRAKSIVTASMLVSEGGKIFVHDCERLLEREFIRKYLSRGTEFIAVEGRALLRGFAF